MNLLTSSVIVSVTATVIVNGNVTSGHPWRKRACPGRCFEAIVATPENVEDFFLKTKSASTVWTMADFSYSDLGGPSVRIQKAKRRTDIVSP